MCGRQHPGWIAGVLGNKLLARTQNGLLVVAYELQDTVANNGGFGCIPVNTPAIYLPN